MHLGQIDVGQIVAGKYELVRLLGKGAMGEVWLAKHDSLGGEFAIKLVRPEAQDADESAIARFQQEAQVSAKLSRKTRHIVSVSDHGEENGLAYLVMELLEGESLEARLGRGGRLDLPETVAIVTQIARALGHAHAEQIVHRDLKPGNVFLTQDEDGRLLVKLLDFGIARATTEGGKRSPFATGKDMVLGTPSYMSPEQARGLASLDHRCDLWALAVVAYEALTSEIPWNGETIEDIFLSICTHEWTPLLVRRPELPPVLEGFFVRSFSEKLSARFRTAAELSEAFVTLAGVHGVNGADDARVGPPSSPEVYVPPSRPNASNVASEAPESGVHGTTMRTRKKKRASMAWIVAAVVGLGAIGVLGLALVAVVAPDKDKARPTPSGPSASAERGTAPPPEPALTTTTTTLTTLAPPEPTATATATATATGKGSTRPGTRPAATAHGMPPTTQAAPPPTPPTVVTPPPPPTPAATVKPPPDKSQVF